MHVFVPMVKEIPNTLGLQNHLLCSSVNPFNNSDNNTIWLAGKYNSAVISTDILGRRKLPSLIIITIKNSFIYLSCYKSKS